MSNARYHEWGDTDFDWKSLYEACKFFEKNLRRYGRISVFTKEKYGTMRLEYFYIDAHYNEFFHSLLKPGYLVVRHPIWLRKIDFKLSYVMRKLGVCKILSMYKRLVFNIVTLKAVKKWGDIRYEIMDEFEFRELLYNSVKKKVNYISHWVDVE